MFKFPFTALMRDSRGASAMLFAVTLPVVFVATGAALDYSEAVRLHTKLNAAADAAVLTAVAPGMMQGTDAAAKAAALAMFNSQIEGLQQLEIDSSQPTITITHPNGSSSARSATVSYVAKSKNFFSGFFLGQAIPISGTAGSTASVAPNVDFYLLLDNSPSMALPATTAGISTEEALTPNNCAFACPQAMTGDSDTDQNPIVNGKYIDNYQVARNAGITLRIDELNTGVSGLLSDALDAQNRAPAPAPTYRFAVSALDSPFAVGDPSTGLGYASIMGLTPNFTSGWASVASNFGLMEVATNNTVCVGGTVNGVYNPCLSNVNNQDGDTDFDNAFRDINTLMPDPGQGTRAPGDKPQEVLFVVTDGVEDEVVGGTRLEQQINAPGAHNYCDDIKARGIQIAVLYTTYLPVPSNPWYVAHIAPIQPQLSPALQACASPGLFYQAAVGEDIATAMRNLFDTLLRSARLTS
jgi:Flp pilus assembly protein TadG